MIATNMAPQEEIKAEVEMPVTDEQYRQREWEQNWYFQRLMYHIAMLRIRCSAAINDSHYLLGLTYGLLFAVLIARILVHGYALWQENSAIDSFDSIVVAGDICLNVVWLIYSVRVLISKWKHEYDENDNRASMAYLIFCMQYYLISSWSTSVVYSACWDQFGILCIILFFAYGFLAEKSPNLRAMVTYLVFVFFVFELIIRLITCHYYHPCPSKTKQVIKKELTVHMFDPIVCEQKMCSICLLDFAINEKICPLSCHKTHVFHIECLKQWLIRNAYCPYCRSPVN